MRIARYIVVLLAVSGVLPAADKHIEFFEMRVRPVLAKNCYACHTTARMGELELNSRQALLKGGKSGPALISGDPDNSLLIQAVRQTDDKLKMPPGGKLSEAEIADLATWIRDGAVWPENTPATAAPSKGLTAEQRAWWAFQPVSKPAPPKVRDVAWTRTAIDNFILAEIEDKKLKPAPPADRRTWIRRAAYDLTGLPPTPAEVAEFVADRSPRARERVIDRLLASPRYGERWGRYWLDIARYADDKLNSTQTEPQPNVWRYRDWVIDAYNADMPYDRFLMAQIAGDRMQDPDRYRAGLGFFANSPQFQEDRVDALTRGFLALTAACAQCHDHKFDPIPARDYYSLLGIFENTKKVEHPLVSKEIVDEYQRRKKIFEEAEKAVSEFEAGQAKQLAEIYAAQTAKYLDAARGAGPAEGLDEETVKRFKEYLEREHEHPYLAKWREAGFDSAAFQALLLGVIKEKNEIDRENLILLGGKDDGRTVRVIEVKSLERDRYMLWKEMVSSERSKKMESGVFYYKGAKIDRHLAPEWKRHVESLRAARDARKKEIPPEYPYLLEIGDVEKPKTMRVRIRGSRENLGEEAPPQFLIALCGGEQKPFSKGNERLELARAVASADNPLTARVAVNRVWMHHFGRPIVATPGNFGRLGEKPSHPALLDYLAARFVEQGWSMKALHREIMLSNVYAMSSQSMEPNATVDADNKLFWRANRRRLEVEPIRDTLLFVSGDLDETRGGEAKLLTEESNLRRTVYGFVSRRSLDRTLALFDFPNPVATSDARIPTATPLQELFFLNSTFIGARAKSLASRVEKAGGDDRARIAAAYALVFQRPPSSEEIKLGLGYLQTAGGKAWPLYAQALLSSSELLFVD
jgi:mono/diheme cytochrome c family protein